MATLNRADLEFILQQIQVAEAHAAGADLRALVPTVFAPVGLRTVDGSFNNLIPGRENFGAADQAFPTLVTPQFDAPYNAPGVIFDGQPRVISNLVADMTTNNPAAVQAYVQAGLGSIRPGDGALLDANGNVIPAGTLLTLPNVTPDAALSAPYNSWFTFFGQFFDHGLDLVNKNPAEVVIIPLQPDDPLFSTAPGAPNFMVLSRTAHDANGNAVNQTTPFVDQNQTYTSHASHQVFLREYALDANGHPVATGKLLNGADGGLPTWGEVKAQAHNLLHIDLDDMDVLNLPLLVTDAYGKFVPGPNGFPQLVVDAGPPPATVSADASTFINASLGVRTGHPFLADIAHAAAPLSDTGAPLAADGDDVINTGPQAPGTYDNELLDRHYITGDGRGNENIALTTVHHVFHSEHNRQIAAIQDLVSNSGDPAFIASWQMPDGSWNGERLFQAARFATEMQYQHLVFEEFARRIQPNINEFLVPDGYNVNIDPAITAEFAHAVFRVGHTMLNETVDRFDPNFVSDDKTLIEAFLNPVGFNNNGALTPEEAAGAVVRGMTRQVGNEIDEFVTSAVRNNLLGLPLDLAALNIARGRDTGVPTLNEARRTFFGQTSESKLAPYTSWVDLTQHLKHEASAVNFIAAYGTHAALQAADVNTVEEKRAVAVALVMGGSAVINAGTPEERTFTADETDRLAFLNSTGIYANTPDGVTTTGVDDIDLWIGGLAERQMPFGGLLGSTFNFVFETQLENLQNGDRFYYLSRTAGLHFGTELEGNSFAQLVMLNTDATHLPADVFSTPSWILEVDQLRQYTGLGAGGHDDPTGGTAQVPLVIRDDPSTAGPDTHFLHYTGLDHVVLGGTSGNDTLISSIGDDALYGDAGNDRLEGGAGNDNLLGGAGDDIITDSGGDDVIHGDAGNDVIAGGNGLNIILGQDGSDFIITGEDISTTFGGAGNDFILGSKLNLPTLGNEGDDWIELGTQDGAGGDNFDPLGLGTIIGHDVFITGGGFDEGEGEGGDDIMVMSDGEDRFTGGGGFDWGSYANDPEGVTADLALNALIEPPVVGSNQGIKDKFFQVEGLSGSAQSDILHGTKLDVVPIGTAAVLTGTLTNPSLYAGMQELLGEGVTSFGSGDIILGGGGSDMLEGREDNDLLDGDRWLNVRISVRQNADGSGPEIRSVNSMQDLVPDMMSGAINPGQLQIVREILTSAPAFDTALFTGTRAEYTVTTNADGSTTVSHNLIDALGAVVTAGAGADGVDTLKNIERIQFADQAVVLTPGLNAEPVGQLTLNDTTPAVNQVLTVSALGLSDADNLGGIVNGRPISYYWQVEQAPGTGVFHDIVIPFGNQPTLIAGPTFQVTPDLDGQVLRVRGVYQDDHGVLENVYSAPTAAVAGSVPLAPVTQPPAETYVDNPSGGVHLIREDLQFMLDQIKIAEANSGAYGTPSQDLPSMLLNTRLPFGLRTVDGTLNNLVPGQGTFGASDQNFPLLLDQVFRNEQDDPSFFGVSNNNYAAVVRDASGNPVLDANGVPLVQNVVDADPRIISNLIVDQTAGNAAAVAANGGADAVMSPGMDGIFGTADDRPVFFMPNVTPDAGLGSPFNAWFTFFGQFFDHGLDLVDKSSTAIFIPLQADDPLIKGADGILGTPDDLPANQRFMVLSRATNTAVQAGADNVLGTADDVHFHNNETTPFVDQNQTYTSHASHQVFLRAYKADAAGHTVATGELLDGAEGGIGNWAEVKAQAAQYLGIQLTDADIFDVPLLATDAYGKFIPGANGFAQVVTNQGLIEGVAGGLDLRNLPGGAIAGRSGHAFLNDIAHNAVPVLDANGNLVADADNVIGNAVPVGPGGNNLAYDNELLDKHFITGDGRGNENIGLTTVHFIFHAEHNRLVHHIKEVALASNDASFANEWLLTDITQADVNAINGLTGAAKTAAINSLDWDGERVFQAARFGTEMQYQHLVFEEFARRVQPNIDPFLLEGQGYDATIDPAIVAEFAHVVYRFGHSMLNETVDRFDPNLNPVSADPQMGLIEAFLNPLAFSATGGTDAQSAGAIVRGLTRQTGNEIDEFVTEALRNNLLGLPLDLPALNIARGRDAGVPTLNQARTQFFGLTGDAQLKPYESWADLGLNLKHYESLVNFVAAYGHHASITGATTLAAKRAAAYALVYGENGLDGIAGTADDTTGVPADRDAFMNGPAATTGVNDIDLWIGGLAEKQMPFGGLLGSTFNFVFENQLEKLQDGDRFYYLERTAGLNFRTELEQNSFQKLISANTDAHHLPGFVFSDMAYTLEVDPAAQLTGLNADGSANAAGRADPLGLVIRDDPNTVGPDTHYLQYTGLDHVVLGGTSGSDTLIASIGDDALHGDGGDDRLDGGDGNDIVFGEGGDDIITNTGGDDNLQGGDGNDAIHGGNGLELILGGFGNDFIFTGQDASEAFGGTGNDFVFGTSASEFVFGNEGDDWIEHGMVDGSSGDNFDARGLDAVIGNDVFFGDIIGDRMFGEGGDDIMIGNGGSVDRYLGASGFDWASFRHPTLGAVADMNLRVFNPTAATGVVPNTGARFVFVEGMSGSAFSDVLIGDDVDVNTILVSGFTGSVLRNFNLIDGLRSFVGTAGDGADGVAGTLDDQFDAGNIILGGEGSDLLEGRGGNDLIDGDRWLDVHISVRANRDGTGAEIGQAANMAELEARVFSGEINPGQLVIVRQIMPGDADPSFDTAVYRGSLAEYTIATDVNGVTTVTHNLLDGAGAVVGVGIDGIDRLTNIERIQFSDQAVELAGFDNMPDGALSISDTTPVVGELLTVSAAGVTDLDNVSATNPTGAVDNVSFTWQSEIVPGSGQFVDISAVTPAGDVLFTGPTYTPTTNDAGLALRVKAVYQDANGVMETLYLAATAPVVDGTPGGSLDVSDTTPTEGSTVIVDNHLTDIDGLAGVVFHYQWQESTGLGGGPSFRNILGATNGSFTPTHDQVNRQLRVVATYTDNGGNANTATSNPTIVTGMVVAPAATADVLIGTNGQDNIDGGGANDVVNGMDGNDLLNGGMGNDTVNGGNGNDTLTYVVGEGADAVDGGGGVDVLSIVGTATPETLTVSLNGGVLTLVAGGSVTNMESFTANLAGGSDSLNYTTTTALTVDLGAGSAPGFTSIAGIENVAGGSGADLLIDAAGVTNRLTGGAGDDISVVHDSGDVVSEAAGGGLDEVRSFANSYAISNVNVENLTFVGSGNFSGTGNAAANAITGGAGDDALNGGAGGDTLTGNAGNDVLVGSAGNDALAGGDGGDNLDGGLGNDTIAAGDGDDTIRHSVGQGADSVDGGIGVDTLVNTGSAANELLRVVISGGVLTSIDSGAVVNVESVTADMQGGADTLMYMGVTEGITVNLAAGTASGFTSIANIENVSTGSGNDVLAGTAGVANVLNGGAGNDVYVVHDASDTVVESSAVGGTDEIRTTLASYTLGSNLENLTFIGTGAFTGTGNAAANAITGSASGDLLSGLAGNDALAGNAGDDSLSGDAGNDTVSGGAGTDTLLGGDGDDTLDGGLGNDIIDAGTGNDTIVHTVNQGADAVDGGGGVDTLAVAGNGADEILRVVFSGTALTSVSGGSVANVESVTADMHAGSDTLSYAGTTAAVTANLGAGTASGFSSIANIENVTGGSGNDVLTGSAASNTLSGGAGNDRLTGGAGNDALNGGIGNDIFVFQAGFGTDRITGFDADATGGQDLMDLSALGITAANFDASVGMSLADINADGVLDMLISIAGGSIEALGVNGVGANAITHADFLLA